MRGKANHPVISIKTRSVVTQMVLIVAPIILCTFLMIQQFTSDTINSKANATYQYDRVIINDLNTATRQMESMSNTIAGNSFVQIYVAMEPGEERERYYTQNVQNLLRYAYNRYLPTDNIQILPGMTLADIQDDQNFFYSRGEYRMWSLQLTDSFPVCKYYHQFKGENETPALVVFSPSDSMLKDTVWRIESINGQFCMLRGTDGQVLFAPEEDTRYNDLLNKHPETTQGYTITDNRTVCYQINCDALPLIFVSVQQVTDSFVITRSTLPYMLICLLIIIGSIFLSYQVFFKGITRKIIRLSDACESLPIDRIGMSANEKKPNGSVDAPSVPVMGKDEIGVLSDSINHMLSRIDELARLNAEEVRTSQRTAYDMLAAQIHPHFIYNTLENLRMMAELDDVPEIADQLYALGRMLRLSISDASSTGEITMEIEHAQMYLQLQKMRLNDRLQYSIEPVPDELLHIKCPRFLLQPLVENALKHGFSDSSSENRITISIGRYSRGIYLRVQNNGTIIPEERLCEIREALKENHPIVNTKGGIGLMNINTRIHMFCGKDSGLTLQSNADKGTVCTLWLVTNE